MNISNGEGWLVKVNNSNRVSNFFDWLEGRRYFPGDTIEYEADPHKISGVSGVGRYAGILRFRLSEDEGSEFYYQQRFNSTENDKVQTVQEFIGPVKDPELTVLAGRLGTDKLMEEKINMLSTGEFRKAYTFKAALSHPAVMFLEEPFAGIDPESYEILCRLLGHLKTRGTSIVIFSSGNHKPDFIDHFIWDQKNENEDYLEALMEIKIPAPQIPGEFTKAFELSDLRAGYFGHEILHDINWTVNRNDQWKLTGPNGAGKSTLLSIVYADNPQAYSNSIYLFDKKRGSGESIWDIKDKIGYYSTELYRYFDKHQSVEEAIDSILFLNPYRKRILTKEEEIFSIQVLQYFGLYGSLNKKLYEQSPELQKLTLIAGVLIKNAPLLILDEPFQGFTDYMAGKARALVNKYARNRTFIMVSHNNSDFPECITRHFRLNDGEGSEAME